MITEDYCSYEVAKLLKEKGFDIECNTAYYNGNLIDYTMYGFCGVLEFIFAPTHQMAVKWLREKDIRICPDYSDVDGKWFTMIGTKKKRTYSGYYDTYEEAIESALKYTLENLL